MHIEYMRDNDYLRKSAQITSNRVMISKKKHREKCKQKREKEQHIMVYKWFSGTTEEKQKAYLLL